MNHPTCRADCDGSNFVKTKPKKINFHHLKQDIQKITHQYTCISNYVHVMKWKCNLFFRKNSAALNSAQCNVMLQLFSKEFRHSWLSPSSISSSSIVTWKAPNFRVQYGPTQVKCRLLSSSILDAMNFQQKSTIDLRWAYILHLIHFDKAIDDLSIFRNEYFYSKNILSNMKMF